ncbi:MAG: amidase [Burkholderiaceae bacterium]|nr:amidase [Burkholderiaceae bacterium]
MRQLTRRQILAGAAALAAGTRATAKAADAPEFLSAAQTVDALRARRFSSLELTDRLISRIERLDADLNAVIVRDFDRARDAAKAADAALARGDTRPLLGVPMTVKESFNVAGLPTTWGIAEAKGLIANDDALVVARVRSAGAVVLGKTNVPVALADWQSYNALHGATRNPWNLDRTPGGSSGGSAAALAAGFGALSLGSDIGGSLRVPAHFSGIAALKPSHGLVPSRGHTPPRVPPLPREPDLAVVGPMARGVDDLALLFDVVAGPDELGAGLGYRLALRPPRQQDLKDFRVLLLDAHPLMPSSTPVRAALERLEGRLQRAGVRVERSHRLLPDLAEVTRVYLRLLLSLTVAGWPNALYERLRGIAATLAPDDRSLGAERARGIALSHRDWVFADGARARQQQQWRALFAEVDVVLCPAMPVTAFAHDRSEPQERRRLEIDGTPFPYLDVGLVWAAAATSAGLPAAVVPIDRGDSALPIGVQIIGPYLEDRTVLAFAALLEREFGGFIAPPGYA